MHLTPHPQSPQLQLAVNACLPVLAPWHGDVFRMVEAPYANERDLLSGVGAASSGQRWNPPGLLTAYGCLDDALAMLEWQLQREKAGMPRRSKHLPLTQVTIIVSLQRVLDFRIPEVLTFLPQPISLFIGENHNHQVNASPEILAQAFGRLAAAAGIQGLIVPARPDPTRCNLVIYRPNLDAASILNIHGKEHLPPPPPVPVP